MKAHLGGVALALALAFPLSGCHGVRPHVDRYAQTISVHDRWLLRGGVVFQPRGVQLVGLVAPDQALRGQYVQAYRHFDSAELRRAIADHADTIRFQVSQYGLDPRHRLYSPAYLKEVVDAVHTARHFGLAVIVSVQAESPAGQDRRCPLPDSGTLRVWKELAAVFRADRGVMLELYNEPDIPPTGGGWALWRTGGLVRTATGLCMAVGMQEIINKIRSRGARNVIIVPGAEMERTIAGMPSLADPASPRDPQLAYGIHYPPLSHGWASWQQNFGDESERVPVVITEWNADSVLHCQPSAPVAAPLLLNYLASKRIGVVGFAFDVPGTIIRNWSYTPTSYRDFQCGVPGGGPGGLLFARFAQQGSGDRSGARSAS